MGGILPFVRGADKLVGVGVVCAESGFAGGEVRVLAFVGVSTFVRSMQILLMSVCACVRARTYARLCVRGFAFASACVWARTADKHSLWHAASSASLHALLSICQVLQELGINHA
eukprot:2928762-Pleurochrysis_carterae.AAC.2